MKRFVNKWQLALLVFVVSSASIFVIFSALERVEYDRSRSRVQQFAQDWGSELVDIGAVGHLNPAAGFGHWLQAHALLERLTKI